MQSRLRLQMLSDENNMNEFKKVFGTISYAISFGFLLVCILGLLIILDKLLAGDGSVGASPIIRQHFMQYILPDGGSCKFGDCFGPVWLRVPSSIYIVLSVITGLISYRFYKLGKKWWATNEAA